MLSYYLFQRFTHRVRQRYWPIVQCTFSISFLKNKHNLFLSSIPLPLKFSSDDSLKFPAARQVYLHTPSVYMKNLHQDQETFMNDDPSVAYLCIHTHHYPGQCHFGTFTALLKSTLKLKSKLPPVNLWCRFPLEILMIDPLALRIRNSVSLGKIGTSVASQPSKRRYTRIVLKLPPSIYTGWGKWGQDLSQISYPLN